MIFGTRNQHSVMKGIVLKNGDHTVQFVEKIKYLGIDQKDRGLNDDGKL